MKCNNCGGETDFMYEIHTWFMGEIQELTDNKVYCTNCCNIETLKIVRGGDW